MSNILMLVKQTDHWIGTNSIIWIQKINYKEDIYRGLLPVRKIKYIFSTQAIPEGLS